MCVCVCMGTCVCECMCGCVGMRVTFRKKESSCTSVKGLEIMMGFTYTQ